MTATFDPVGSTATLVIERFRQNGMEPTPQTATMLLTAVLSDTVMLNSPTTTNRDRVVVDYLERALEIDALELGREMFEASSDVSGVSADEIVAHDAKEYQLAGGETFSISQIEVVGDSLLERKQELHEELERMRADQGYPFAALMVTDISAQGTELLVAGDPKPLERVFDQAADGGSLSLPGVMSRKKQVAPKLLSAR